MSLVGKGLELISGEVLIVIWRLCIRMLIVGVVILSLVLHEQFLIVHLVYSLLILILYLRDKTQLGLDLGVPAEEVAVELESVLEVVVLESLEPLVHSNDIYSGGL